MLSEQRFQHFQCTQLPFVLIDRSCLQDDPLTRKAQAVFFCFCLGLSDRAVDIRVHAVADQHEPTTLCAAMLDGIVDRLLVERKYDIGTQHTFPFLEITFADRFADLLPRQAPDAAVVRVGNQRFFTQLFRGQLQKEKQIVLIMEMQHDPLRLLLQHGSELAGQAYGIGDTLELVHQTKLNVCLGEHGGNAYLRNGQLMRWAAICLDIHQDDLMLLGQHSLGQFLHHDLRGGAGLSRDGRVSRSDLINLQA